MKMGSGGWFKAIVGIKKSNKSKSGVKSTHELASAQPNQSKSEDHEDSNHKENAGSSTAPRSPIRLTEDAAATRIQAAFRSYKARRVARHLKCATRLRTIAESSFMKKQTITTLSYLQKWHKIQSEILSRRHYMVAEGKKKQRKLETQLKLEAKLHDIEVEWCGGSETKEEIVSRIQYREEATVKRERALAYAFSHQWRANSGQSCLYDFGKGEWGWSWMDRWVAARPWEARVNNQHLSTDKAHVTAASKMKKGNSLIQRSTGTADKPGVENGRGFVKRLSFPMTAVSQPAITSATALKVKNVRTNAIQEPSKVEVAA